MLLLFILIVVLTNSMGLKLHIAWGSTYIRALILGLILISVAIIYTYPHTCDHIQYESGTL